MAMITNGRIDQARVELLDKYRSRIEVNPALSRSLVSFQSNRQRAGYRWFKYKEGFSAELVQHCLKHFVPRKDARILDPFAGSGVTLFASQEYGRKSHGFEILPVGVFAMQARLAAKRTSWAAFQKQIGKFQQEFVGFRDEEHRPFRHLTITLGAFPEKTQRGIDRFRAYVSRRICRRDMRLLFDFACLSILETVSYTRKDGQYLRWDERANRKNGGKTFNKGVLPDFELAIERQLNMMLEDMAPRDWFFAEKPSKVGEVIVEQGSCFHLLRTVADNSFDAVITSPPYCNRYDYTRSYALELAYLEVGDAKLKELRQGLLSCTVENKAKVQQFQEMYGVKKTGNVFTQAWQAFEEQQVLHGILRHLCALADKGDLNNTNIPRMVRNYFLESSVVIHELARVLKPGARMVMVNDNVQYAGEEIPVDLILCDFAEHAGLVVEHIWTLGRGKGNSSQQMGAHGRNELRKCAYIWRKP